MPEYNSAHRRRLEEERLRRQQLVWQRMRAVKDKRCYQSSGNSFFNTDFSEWRMRRITPFALLIHACTVILLISWFVTNRTYEVDKVATNNKSNLLKFDIESANRLYLFNITQAFPAGTNPLYSELEIEILDSELDHIYSVYKDLWQERHSNGDGGWCIYKDLSLEFELVLPEAGTYYIRPISHNNNKSPIRASIHKVLIGGIYMPYYAILFGAASLILLFGNSTWGSPSEMMAVLPKLRSWKDNNSFKLFALACFLIVSMCCITAIPHYGYA